MIKYYIPLITATLLTTATYAQDAGKKNVDKLCGCFSVNYRYAETFSPDIKYKYHEREDMNAMELVLPLENTDKKVVLQHLLLINDTMIIKHWREEWLYESPVLYAYEGNKVWNKKQLPPAAVKNAWTQTVWEVNDEPRYQGISQWMENDGNTFWESTADAPLPRREYTTRSDYNILKRRNRIMLTAEGYVHEQDNDKILRTEKGDKLIVLEKGYNTYYRVEDKECDTGKKWWKKNGAFWTVVRDQWQQYLSATDKIAVKSKVDDKILGDYFTALWKDWSNNKVSTTELPGKVKEVLTKFL